MKKVERVIERLCDAAGYLASVVMLSIIVLTLVEVVTRYVLREPLILCDEFGGYSLFAISFLGLSYCAKERGHIRITFLVERMSARLAGWLRVGTLALSLAYAAVAGKVSWDFLIYSFHRNIRSNSWLMTPLKWPQMALPIGLSLFALALALQLVHTAGKVRSGMRVEESAKQEE
jgi:TRAP-type C4-dicarboxylate transport system permease small subunit